MEGGNGEGYQPDMNLGPEYSSSSFLIARLRRIFRSLESTYTRCNGTIDVMERSALSKMFPEDQDTASSLYSGDNSGHGRGRSWEVNPKVMALLVRGE